MGSEDTHVISGDHCHHDTADWLEEWHGKVQVISQMSTAGLKQRIAYNTDLGARPNVVGDLQSSTKSVKGREQLMIPEQVVPMSIEKIGLVKRKLLGMTDITGEIDGTLPELFKTEKNVTTQETHKIFGLKDVLRKSDMHYDSP